jgi:hypothetical protein
MHYLLGEVGNASFLSERVMHYFGSRRRRTVLTPNLPSKPRISVGMIPSRHAH